jgi:hypothetical protein
MASAAAANATLGAIRLEKPLTRVSCALYTAPPVARAKGGVTGRRLLDARIGWRTGATVVTSMNMSARTFTLIALAVALNAACGSASGTGPAAPAGDTAMDAAGDAGSDPLDAGSDSADGGDPTPSDADTSGDDETPPDSADARRDAGDTEPTDPADIPGDDAILQDVADADAGDGATDPADDTPGPDSDTPDAPAAWIRVGTGFSTVSAFGGYTPVEDGAELVITEGPQGGFHLWGGLEGGGLPEADLEAEWSITTPGGDVVGGAYSLTDTLEYGTHRATAGVTVFIDLALDVLALDGQPLRMCATAFVGEEEPADCVDVVARCCSYLDGGP